MNTHYESCKGNPCTCYKNEIFKLEAENKKLEKYKQGYWVKFDTTTIPVPKELSEDDIKAINQEVWRKGGLDGDDKIDIASPVFAVIIQRFTPEGEQDGL